MKIYKIKRYFGEGVSRRKKTIIRKRSKKYVEGTPISIESKPHNWSIPLGLR